MKVIPEIKENSCIPFFMEMNSKLPQEVRVEDKTANEKVQLISKLDEDDKTAVYRIIDGMMTKNKFQTFFDQNI